MLKIDVDFSDFLDLFDLEGEVKVASREMGMGLATATYSHIIEEAQKKLHSTKEQYIEALSIGEDDNTFFVVLDGSMTWLEDGMPSRNLLEDLLASPKAKTSKSGSRYLTVPFQLNKKEPSPAQLNLVNAAKQALRDKGINFKKIEKGPDGQPKLGLLHKTNINGPIRQSPSGSAQQGQGAFGQPIQAPNGVPFLRGLSVYQSKVQDKHGKDSIKRFVGTFRTASSKQSNQLWNHPGIEGFKLFDEAAEWAQKELEKQFEELKKKL